MKWTAMLIVAAAVAVGLVTAADSPCPAGFVDMNDDPLSPDCHAFVINVGLWHNMEYWCHMIGANMSKVTGILHNKLYQYIINTPSLSGHCFWIGATDEEEEGRWIWESDGSEVEMGPPHWDPYTGDPNGFTSQNYVCICPDNYYFRDCDNDSMIYGICQI